VTIQSLTVVVPAFNERDNLPATLDDLRTVIAPAVDELEILVVDDGSRDGSAEFLAQQTPPVRVITHPQNAGLTAALRTGFYGARKQLVTWVPADGQIPAVELLKVLSTWDGHDLVLSTYRHRPDGIVRAVMSRTLRLMLRAAIGLRDRLEGPYLFRRAFLDGTQLVARTSAGTIGFEIAAKIRAADLRVTSVEIECAPRRSGQSKVANARNIAATLGEIWRIRRSM
jgi:glycosyltransferase involved in cell wall biosynthesis